jgi:hypothetical protein
MSKSPLILAASDWSIAPQWAFNRWVVLLAVALAGAMIVYLYRAQRKVASTRVVAVLTALRVGLVLLTFVLLAGLSLRWKRTASSGGTLWVVIDRSGSMGHADAQATPVEKLRWADALGFLSPGMRTSRLDHAAARLSALRAELAHLRTRADGAAAGDVSAELRRWADRLRVLADDVEQDPLVRQTDVTMPQALRSASERTASQAGLATYDQTLKTLDTLLAALGPLADRADQKFLADHATDAKVTEALANVSSLTRAQLANLALTVRAAGGTALSELFPRQDTRVVSFADAPQLVTFKSVAELSKSLDSAPTPSAGQSTNMAAPLRFVSQQLAQDEPAAVVFVGDGRHNNGGDLVEPARRLASRGVRVFTLALGSQQVAPDAAVDHVDVPDWVYQDDTVRAAALLRLDGLAGKAVTVDFYRGDRKVDSKTVTATGERGTHVVGFTDKPPEPGVYEYAVRVADLPDDAVKENNRLSSRVAVKMDKLAVLLVEDQPRWEHRHLVNYLSRDKRVKLQTVLMQPARVENVEPPPPVRASPKNEGVEAQLLPASKEDWGAFDLIVLGDVPREGLTDDDQQNLAWAVKERGATLLLIAGPFHMPHRFGGTPLAELAPVELSGDDWAAAALPEHLKKGFRPTIAAEGHGSILSQFTIDEADNTSLWSALPPWYWHSEHTRAKRSANVVWTIGALASVSPAAVLPASAGGTPVDATIPDESRDRALLATASVGMGRVMYLASDSTWRMRQVSGQNPHERFWGQVIRWVVGNELPAGGKLLRFGTDKPRYVAGEPVVVTARLTGEDFAPLRGQKLKAVAKPAGPGDARAAAEAEMSELPDAPGYYRATIGGLSAGSVEVSLEGEPVQRLLDTEQVSPAQRKLALDVQSQLTVEQRNINADRAAMARLAEAGGGIALEGPYADVLAEHLPKLNYETERVEQYGLFADPNDPRTRTTHWLFLALFAAVATAEWVIRKAVGLV